MTPGSGPRSTVAFLLGAGRSGTTLLYKLLSLHPDVAYISNYDVGARFLPPGRMPRLVAGRIDAKLQAWFQSGGNAYFVNRPWAKRFFPTPVEGEPVYAGCGMPLFPSPDHRPDQRTSECLRRRFERIRLGAGARVLVSKRTANNRRLRQIDAVFPEARYIHLIRDGREVAQSLSRVEWWDGHTIWWDGRTAAEMEQAGEDRLSVCAKNWVREVNELCAALSDVNPERILEIRYERLLDEPLHQLANILRFLALPLSDRYREAIDTLQLTRRPAAWSTHWSSEQLARVMREELPLLSELGYLQGSAPTQ